jgi:outer membrane protein OmpA-like peptidoglycan-associated protein
VAFWHYVAVSFFVASGLFAHPAFAADEEVPEAEQPAEAATPHKEGISTGMVQPCEGRIRIRGLRFNTDDSTLRHDHSALLDQVAQFLRERCPGHAVLIEGHTDAPGSAAYNQELSKNRAEAVKNYLVEKGVPAEQLTTVGYGEQQPIASSDTKAGRALNRRVTLRFTDKDQ